MGWIGILRLILFAVLLAAILSAVFYFRNVFNVEALETTIRSYGLWAPLIFMFIYIVAVVLFLPGSVLTITGGLVFGPFWGTLYNIIGATTGATLAFLIARYLASDWVAQKTGGRLKQLITGVEEEGWRFVAVVRLVPLIPFNLLNYALGLTRITVRGYVFASFVFMLPGAIAYTYVGSLGQAAIRGETQQLITRGFIALSLLILVGVIPYVIKKYKKNEK